LRDLNYDNFRIENVHCISTTFKWWCFVWIPPPLLVSIITLKADARNGQETWWPCMVQG
jgi:hypothetical protein